MKLRKLRLDRTYRTLNKPRSEVSRQNSASNPSRCWEIRFNRLPFFLPFWLSSLLPLSPAFAAAAACSASYITDEVRQESTIDQFGSKFQGINVFSFEFNG